MTQDSSPYFRRVAAEASFDAARMSAADLLAGSHLTCSVASFEPGQSHETHMHGGSDQVFAVIDGRGRFTVGSESRDLGPGEIALAPAGISHGLVASAGVRLVVLVITSPPTGPATVVPALAEAPAPVFAGNAHDAAVDGTILQVGNGLLVFQADPLTEPLTLTPASHDVAQLPIGPARLVIETAAKSFNRTMGTARSVQTRDGVPVRFTGMVVRIDGQRKVILVDVGYPVLAHDLGGFAADSLAPGSGVMFQAEGPTRASSPG